MKLIVLSMSLFFLISPSISFASQEIHFNLFCSYKKKIKDKEGYEACRSAAKFLKGVGPKGEELHDFSSHINHPDFEVECDQHLIFNNRAQRLTDHYGTRIQGLPGPFPAILLPRDTLKEGRRYVKSSLELEGQILPGYCYLYNSLP